MTRSDDKGLAVAAHLLGYLTWFTVVGGVVGPLVVWLVTKEDSPFAAAHAKEALNFQISMLVYGLVAGVLCFVLIGFLLLPVVALLHLVLPILAAVKASEGRAWRYPLTFRLV